MAKKKAVDAKALIMAVESGLPRKEIQAQFGFKSPGQVAVYYLDALFEKGKVKGIDGRAAKKAKPAKKANHIKIGKRSSLTITRGMIEEMGFEIGDAFSIRKTRNGISMMKHKE